MQGWRGLEGGCFSTLLKGVLLVMRVTEGRNSLKTKGKGKFDWHISRCLPINLLNLKRQGISWVVGMTMRTGIWQHERIGGATVSIDFLLHSLRTDALSLWVYLSHAYDCKIIYIGITLCIHFYSFYCGFKTFTFFSVSRFCSFQVFMVLSL